MAQIHKKNYIESFFASFYYGLKEFNFDFLSLNQHYIVLMRNDQACSRQQAIIQHTSEGYKILELSVNGMTRIAIRDDEQLVMIPGLTISFGVRNVAHVVKIYDACVQQQVKNKADDSTFSILMQEIPISEEEIIDNKDFTIVCKFLEERPKVMVLLFTRGSSRGTEIHFTSDKPIMNVGRGDLKDIYIPPGDISENHERFVFNVRQTRCTVRWQTEDHSW